MFTAEDLSGRSRRGDALATDPRHFKRVHSITNAALHTTTRKSAVDARRKEMRCRVCVAATWLLKWGAPARATPLRCARVCVCVSVAATAPMPCGHAHCSLRNVPTLAVDRRGDAGRISSEGHVPPCPTVVPAHQRCSVSGSDPNSTESRPLSLRSPVWVLILLTWNSRPHSESIFEFLRLSGSFKGENPGKLGLIQF